MKPTATAGANNALPTIPRGTGSGKAQRPANALYVAACFRFSLSAALTAAHPILANFPIRKADSLFVNKHRQLRSLEQLLEIGVEGDKVFAEVNDCRREPCVGNIVGA